MRHGVWKENIGMMDRKEILFCSLTKSVCRPISQKAEKSAAPANQQRQPHTLETGGGEPSFMLRRACLWACEAWSTLCHAGGRIDDAIQSGTNEPG